MPPESRGLLSLGQVSDEALAVVAPLLRAGRVARFRVLDVRCSSGAHRLGQVLKTSLGPVFLGTGQRSEGWSVVEGEIEDGTRRVLDSDWQRTHRGAVICYPLDQLATSRVRIPVAPGEPEHWNEPAIEAQCRCRRHTVPLAWIEAQIAAGRRVAFVDDPSAALT